MGRKRKKKYNNKAITLLFFTIIVLVIVSIIGLNYFSKDSNNIMTDSSMMDQKENYISVGEKKEGFVDGIWYNNAINS